MKEQEQSNFNRIAEAIGYIKDYFKTQPGLEEVAEKIHVSPFHFQRLFTEWAGVSPKKFLQYIAVEHAKKMLKDFFFQHQCACKHRLHQRIEHW